jgi:hypothetical protein
MFYRNKKPLKTLKKINWQKTTLQNIEEEKKGKKEKGLKHTFQKQNE